MYNLKDKIEVTKEFLNDLIAKSWQEAEAIQQQAANINTSTYLGTEVAKLLKNTCTNYYVLIGCLESLIENPSKDFINTDSHVEAECIQKHYDVETLDTPRAKQESEDLVDTPTDIEQNQNFEPFEYFVDFDEPSGESLSDKDLYNN